MEVSTRGVGKKVGGGGKDLLSICDETENDGEGQNGDLPKWNRKLRSCCVSR